MLLLVLGLWTIPILERGSLLMTLLEQGEAIDLDESMRSVDDPPRISNEALPASALDTDGMLAELPLPGATVRLVGTDDQGHQRLTTAGG
jgi:hypothetical protein